MKYSSVLLSVLVSLLHAITVSSMDRPWSARHRAMANARCSLFADLASIAVQPASISWMPSFAVSVSFTPALFDLPELQTHALMVGFPLSFGGIGFGVRRFGFELYRETSIVMGSGISMDNGLLAAGMSAEFRRYAIKGYGAQTVLLLNVGAVRRFHKMVTVSGTVDNAFNASLGTKNERLPRALSLGLTASLSEFLGAVELEKNTRDPAFLKVAVEFRPLPSVALKSGVSTDPVQWSAGCSVSLGPVFFEYGGTHHGILGWTHQVDVMFREAL